MRRLGNTWNLLVKDRLHVLFIVNKCPQTKWVARLDGPSSVPVSTWGDVTENITLATKFRAFFSRKERETLSSVTTSPGAFRSGHWHRH